MTSGTDQPSAASAVVFEALRFLPLTMMTVEIYAYPIRA